MVQLFGKVVESQLYRDLMAPLLPFAPLPRFMQLHHRIVNYMKVAFK